MAEIKKITKREVINDMLSNETIKGNEMYVNYLTHELELLDRKKATDVKTKNQVANENLKEVIVNTLQELDKMVTIAELQKANEVLSTLSNQKISALLKQLVDTEIVKRDKDSKRVTRFGV